LRDCLKYALFDWPRKAPRQENQAQPSIVERRMARIAEIIRNDKGLVEKAALGVRHPTWSDRPGEAPHTGWVVVNAKNNRSTIFIDVKAEPHRKPVAYYDGAKAQKEAEEIAKAISRTQGWLGGMETATYGSGGCQRTKAKYIKL